MRFFVITALVCVALPALDAQNMLAYSALSIPPALRAGASTVVREHELTLNIASPADMETHFHIVSTVLDKRGGDKAILVLPYDRFNTYRDIRGQLYDALGMPGKKFGKKDFEDVAYLDDWTIAETSRYLYLDLSGQTPPFSFELEYTMRSKSALFCPDYLPQPGYNTAVEHARCIVELPASQTLLYQCARSPEPVLAAGNKSKRYAWEFSNLAAIPDEPYNLPISQLAPVVRLNPADFQIDEFTGSFSSWNGFAEWIQQMLSTLPPLSDATKQQIRQLTQGLSEKDKIRTVYRFLQNNTRYVSVQLGIGGWKPFDPNVVHDKKYGDCKALSWYAHCLLQAAGVDAYYTLVYAGDNPRELDPAFPNNSFNHVILTVPTSGGDTTWLECTSQIVPFGYMGTFTGNRKALAIGAGKAQVIQLPAPPAEQNLRTDSVAVQLLEGGKTARVEWHASFGGLAIEDDKFYAAALYSDPQDRKKWIEEHFSFKGSQLKSFDLQVDSTTSGNRAAGTVSVEAVSAQLLNVTPKRIYFQPNFFQSWPTVLAADSARVSPVFCRFGHSYAADLRVDIPAGWSPETLPAPVEEATPFGTFSRSVQFTDNTLHYHRTITLRDGTFPPERYGELVAFFKKMKKWDGENAVFVQKS